MSSAPGFAAATQKAAASTITSAHKAVLQRQCDCGQHAIGECEECKEKNGLLQRKSAGEAREGRVPPIVNDVLRSPGQPLDSQTRAFFEPRFGADFSRVRVHSHQHAAQSARAIRAHAYTIGSDVVFGEGRYAPETTAGKHLLAHELAHVLQQNHTRGIGPMRVSVQRDALEEEADEIASRVASQREDTVRVQPHSGACGLVQCFSAQEHIEIGDAAYSAAPPHRTSASAGPHPAPMDKELVKSLKQFHYKRADGSGTDLSYGQLVAMADNVASFQLMEDQDRERAGRGFRVPVLSRIWDAIGDKTHYLDLAARNRAHFHPHNFMAWQAWHWAALASMEQAAKAESEADALNVAIGALLKSFGERSRRVRKALEDSEKSGAHTDVLDKTISSEIAVLEKQIEEIRAKQARVSELRARAKDFALNAVAVNGFGDHFLTDAYSGGHIVTPRAELLDQYTTKFLGLIKVGGVMHCANIPSLAWHDLDNKFGVRVKNRAGKVWTTFGDNYLHNAAPKNEPTTFQQVVEATTLSVRHLWETAAGRKPTGLLDVLNLLPAPVLDPAIYPAWTPEDWRLQLRHSAGELIGQEYDPSTGAVRKTQEKVPNPKGEQVGSGPLSARATCIGLLDVFSYDRFVVPMIQQVRQHYAQKFFSGSAEQILPPTARPKPQDSVIGNVALGSLIGGLGGALIGLAAGGGVGALIGGAVGLVAGAFVGGLIGKQRKN